MKNLLSNLSKSKISVIVVVLVVIGAGLFVTNKLFWFFGPAFSDKTTAQAFFRDLSKNNTLGAYTLTSANFQSNYSYSNFLAQTQILLGNTISVKFSNYVASKTAVSMEGTINDQTLGQTLVFQIKTVKSSSGNKVDYAVVTQTGAT